MATTTASPLPAASPPTHRRSPWTVLGVMCLGLFMVLLDTTIVNVALPQLMDQLGATLNQAFWVFSAYVLGFATLLVTAGRLGDTYGPRRVYLVGLTVFVLGSALAGLAQQPGQLIGARVVQGVGAALLTPQLLPVVTMVFRPSRWGSAFGFIGALSGIAVLVGPTLGGVVVTTLGWRWIFFLNLPVGLVGFLLVRRLVHDYRPGLVQRLGLGQVAILTGGLGCVTYGLIEGQRFDWPLWIFALIGLGVLLAVVFGRVQQRQQRRSPLVPVDLVRARAQIQGREVEIVQKLCEGAFEAVSSGDGATHDRIVAEGLRELMAEVDAIVLAQASMARVVDSLPPEEKTTPIFSSPRLGMEALREAVDAV